MSIKIGIDTMGGDYGIVETIKGSINSLKEFADLKLTLYGDEKLVNDELKKYDYDKSKINVINATEEITPEDTPTKAIKEKKNSSMVLGLTEAKENKIDGFVSCGNTGALLTGATLIIGRIKGIKRPALGVLLPNNDGYHMLLDVGANIEPKPLYLKQFATLGSIYFEEMMEVKNPSVGLINIGTEKGKGTAVLNEAYDLLENTKLNFKGFVESREIPFGKINVLVADAFTGNVILKYTEGFAKSLTNGLKSELTKNIFCKLGALFVLKPMSNFKKRYDYKEIGGAPLLGLNKLVVKAHGNSDAKAFKGAIRQCYNFAKKDITGKIEREFKNEE